MRVNIGHIVIGTRGDEEITVQDILDENQKLRDRCKALEETIELLEFEKKELEERDEPPKKRGRGRPKKNKVIIEVNFPRQD